MKKLIALAAVAACGASLAVESANIVGYQTTSTAVTVQDNFVLLAPSFLNVSDGVLSTDTIKCDQTVNTLNETQDEEIEGWTDDAAAIMVPDGLGSYAWRYYVADAYDEVEEDFVEGWASDDTLLNTLEFDLGVGVWVRGKVGTATTITFSGAISDNASEQVARAKPIEVELVANPYPTALSVNSDKVTWTLDAVNTLNETQDEEIEGWTDDAAAIMVPDGYGSYAWRYYVADAYDEVKEDFVKGWASDDTLLNDISIPAGTGFWLRRISADGKNQAWSFTVEL